MKHVIGFLLPLSIIAARGALQNLVEAAK